MIFTFFVKNHLLGNTKLSLLILWFKSYRHCIERALHFSLFLHSMFFCFFLFGFNGPFKNISLISSRSFIKGGRKLENPEKNHLTIHKQNLALRMVRWFFSGFSGFRPPSMNHRLDISEIFLKGPLNPNKKKKNKKKNNIECKNKEKCKALSMQCILC